jgi:chloramphenicol 3-O phosphotransferase
MTPGQIILLNGASSAGKTSLIKILQDQLPEPYLDAGLDRFLWMLPRRYLDRPGWDEVLGLMDHAGPVGKPFISGLHHAIAALSLAGNNVLADHVLVESAWVHECARLFAGLPALFVGLRCPLEILELRESQRGDRTLGQARTQFPLVHAHGLYDLEMDTSLSGPAECAAQIIQHLRSGPPPIAFRRLAELY